MTQSVYTVDKKQKAAVLTRLIHDNSWSQALVFTKTKHGANKLTKHLEAEGIVAAAIHGNKSQGARTKALAGFKAGEIRILVATDIAARGLDIEQLPQVVNLICQMSPKTMFTVSAVPVARALLVQQSLWSVPMKWTCSRILSV